MKTLRIGPVIFVRTFVQRRNLGAYEKTEQKCAQRSLGLFTARKWAEQARRVLAHALRLALAGELTASIAHGINQPLGAILGRVSILRGHDSSSCLRTIPGDCPTRCQFTTHITHLLRPATQVK